MRHVRRAPRSLLLLCLACLLASAFLLSPAGLARLTPALASAPADEGVSPDAFTASLIGALVSRNDAALLEMMGDPFVWASWSGEGEELAPPDALQRLRDELLGESLGLTFVAPIVIDEWMRGADPLAIWPPEVQPVTVIGVGGLGVTGEGQAILVVAQDADGAFYWYSLLAAPGGFAAEAGDPPLAIVLPSLPVDANILPSNVQQVLVLGPVGVFDGPGSQYNQIGTAVRGQVYPVLGASADGQWWAVTCADFAGPCWISANPTFVRPVVVSGPAPTRTPAPQPTARPTLRPTPLPTNTPVPAQPERINFAPGQERAVRSGPLWANTVKQYIFRAAAGQFPTIRLSSPSPAATFGVVGMADGIVYKSQGDMRREWTFQAPRTQDYLISILAPVNTSYTLELIIPRPGPQPTATAQPTVIPPARPERINFAPGQVSAVRSGVLVGGAARQYIFKALGGQQTTVLVTGAPGSDVNFSLRGASDGVVYKSPGDPSREWSSTLPRTQDYLITIFASGETAYTLELTILPLGPTATPTVVPPGPAERINFAPGQDSAVRSGPLAANQYKRYVFGGMAGQTATIVLSSPSPSASFSVVGVSDGIPYKTMGSGGGSFSFTLPMTQDYLISILATVNTSYSLVLTIPPVLGPTVTPTLEPTIEPTLLPTLEPTIEPTLLPTLEPTVAPTLLPTLEPTAEPTLLPTLEPTATATDVPPTVEPTATATDVPPTVEPTAVPTLEPPTAEPTIELPTVSVLPEPPGDD